jgi:hypothetical protein
VKADNDAPCPTPLALLRVPHSVKPSRKADLRRGFLQIPQQGYYDNSESHVHDGGTSVTKLTRRRLLGYLASIAPLAMLFRQPSEHLAILDAGPPDFVIVDGWILRHEDVNRVFSDAG